MLPGPGGLYGCIEGQDIGLEGDFIDDLDDLGDIGRRRIDVLHSREHFLHIGIADSCLLARLDREVIGLARIFRIAGRLRRDLRNRG